MIVIDTNVMVKLVIGGPGGAGAARLYDRDKDWAAPQILKSELRNVLIGFVRHGIVPRDEAVSMMDHASLILGDRVFDASHSDVIEVALNCGLTAYDAEFVVVARLLGVSLATEDRAILRSAPDVAEPLSTRANGQA